MDPVTNPFAPGAGTPPPELAGRDEVREAVRIALERIRRGRPAKSVLLVGLRGVGKTVLLDRMREEAEAEGIQTTRLAKPAAAEGVTFETDGLNAMLDKTHCYPYFLQEWGKHAWEAATQSPITLSDVEEASTTAVAALDESFPASASNA